MMKNQYSSRLWHDFREKIIERDGDWCVRCGKNSSDDGVILQVHHKEYIPGIKVYDYPPAYLETLCKHCHAVEHGIIPPKTGWTYVDYEDLGELEGNCEYCGTEIRYVFFIYHKSWGFIEVGEICCDRLTDTDIASLFMKSVDKKKNFLKSTRWKYDPDKKCYRINQVGITVEIKHEQLGYRIYMDGICGKNIYPTDEAARSHVFDVIENGKAKKFIELTKRIKQHDNS